MSSLQEENAEMFGEYTHNLSHGHQGNQKERGGATLSQTLDELFRSSNTILSIPLLSTLSKIFETSQASPFTGLETTAILKFVTGKGLGLFESASSVRSIIGSIPIIKDIVGKGR
jgi:hypothetical protein